MNFRIPQKIISLLIHVVVVDGVGKAKPIKRADDLPYPGQAQITRATFSLITGPLKTRFPTK